MRTIEEMIIHKALINRKYMNFSVRNASSSDATRFSITLISSLFLPFIEFSVICRRTFGQVKRSDTGSHRWNGPGIRDIKWTQSFSFDPNIARIWIDHCCPKFIFRIWQNVNSAILMKWTFFWQNPTHVIWKIALVISQLIFNPSKSVKSLKSGEKSTKNCEK